ncbi:GntR family transcriptional regulator [Methylobacterium sp. GC_Met_2]|uniref:GntR family transcriptional regulator n=1 Tax=Methylobacterium sp. GC_Met_2 TaxID=2937376 RepID=UPI00226B9113|nr:GntR family transcriptional regulator [Methylobacterium sp. GC_Met_2]
MEGQLRSEAEKSWLPGSPGGDRPLSRRAYDAIFTAIQDGQLAPGSLVREADLTTWLEMSRTPLRDALQRLEAEGLLSMQSHRGIRIAALDQQQVSELYTAREWAEGAAASLAARYATPVDIARMRHILEQERASADDPVAGARHNRDLHLTIHTCARNRYLAEHLSSMAALLALVGNTRRRNANRVVEAEQEHTALVAAIADGDSQRAEASARQHIQAAQRNVLTHWVGA